MVLQVPLAGKSVAGDAALTSIIMAEEGLLTVSMQTVCLTLMAKEARGRGEAGTLACLGLAPVRLQVGVDKFAVMGATTISN